MIAEKSVSIIGPGRAGGALALALDRAGWRVNELIYRSSPPGQLADLLGSDPVICEFPASPDISSQVLVIAVQDSLIEGVAAATAKFEGEHRIVLHISGAESSDLLEPLRASGRAVGSFHPLVSLADWESGAANLRGASFCFEGDPYARTACEDMNRDLEGQMFSIPTAAKASYHAAAVMACGHLVALLDAAAEVLGAAGLSREEGLALLMPLIRSTVANLGSGSAESALTGPFKRGDAATIAKHLDALGSQARPETIGIYAALGMRALEIAERGGLSRESAEEIRRKISLAK